MGDLEKKFLRSRARAFGCCSICCIVSSVLLIISLLFLISPSTTNIATFTITFSTFFCTFSLTLICCFACTFFIVPSPEDIEKAKVPSSPSIASIQSNVSVTAPVHTNIVEGKQVELTNFQVFDNKLAEKKIGEVKPDQGEDLKLAKAKLNMTL